MLFIARADHSVHHVGGTESHAHPGRDRAKVVGDDVRDVMHERARTPATQRLDQDARLDADRQAVAHNPQAAHVSMPW